MSEDERPEGWSLSLLSSVTSHITDGTHMPPARETSGVPLLSAKDIDKGQITISESRFVPEDYYESEQRRTKLAENDVLVTIVGSIGRSAIVPAEPKFTFQRSVAILKPSAVTAKYLSYYLESPQAHDFYRARSRGTAQQGLYLRDLKQLPIPVPPFDVQQQITEFIDGAQTKRRAARQHLVSAQRVIERFRQAVLAAACSGHLTADWRAENVGQASAKALVEKIDSLSQSTYKPKSSEWEFDVPDTWELVSLDRLTTVITSGSRGWAKYYAESGPLFIRAQNISHDLLDLTDMAHVRPPSGAEGERTKIKLGDLLITITGANVTKSAFVDQPLDEAYINQHVALARPVLTELTPYLHLWITSPAHGRSKLSADAYGAGKPGLNLDNVRTTPIGLPPIDEQREIMQRVNALLTTADRILERVRQASNSVDHFTQSILTKAFQGDLSRQAEPAMTTEAI